MIRATARHLYESTAVTFDAVAREFGITSRTVKRWSAADGGWRKPRSPEITARAHAVADKITSATVQANEDRLAITDELRTEAAIDERAAIIARHRSEWGIVRGLVAEAVRGRDQAKALLAINVGKAITLAQTGERRAWGLDASENNPKAVTVVIERG